MKSGAAVRLLAVLSILAISQITAALGDDDLAANPYRPSVGSPANLSVPGHFELEAGFAGETASGARVNYTPMLLKYAFTDRIGVTFGISPWIRASSPDGSISGNGNGALTLKLAQPVSDAFMIGGELTATVPVASHDLGSDRSALTLNLIASNDFAGFHSDINVNATRLGDTLVPGASGQVYGWSAGISHPLNEEFGAGIELSGTRQSGLGTTNQWLTYVSYAVSKKLVLDMYGGRGSAIGIRINKVGFGFTYLFAR